jgi:hypothetical protein
LFVLFIAPGHIVRREEFAKVLAKFQVRRALNILGIGYVHLYKFELKLTKSRNKRGRKYELRGNGW